MKKDILKRLRKELRRKTFPLRELKAKRILNKYNKGSYFVKLIPKYISQTGNANRNLVEKKDMFPEITDIMAMKRFGAGSMKEFNYWAWRSCGIACIQSLISTFNGDFKDTTYSLVKEGVMFEGYNIKTDVGWYHDALMRLAKKYGIKSSRYEPVSSLEIPSHILQNHYVMTSMKSNTGGHLLLLYGFRVGENGKLEGFWYHNPNNSRKKGKSLFIKKEEFDKEFKNRIIELYK